MVTFCGSSNLAVLSIFHQSTVAKTLRTNSDIKQANSSGTDGGERQTIHFAWPKLQKRFFAELVNFLTSLRIELCLWIYAIYPLLQCQSSSSSVGKSIWPEFRGPRFESWLDLNVFFRYPTLLTWRFQCVFCPTTDNGKRENLLRQTLIAQVTGNLNLEQPISRPKVVQLC